MRQKGFTIIELMVATLVFSFIMVICLTGMVQVSRAYYKGVTNTKTQEAARNIIEEIAQNIQLSGSVVTFDEPNSPGPNIPNVANGIGGVCAGNKQFTFAIDREVANSTNEGNKEIKNAIVSHDVKCTDSLTLTNLNQDVTGSDRSLVPEKMRVTKFNVTRVVPGDPDTVKSAQELWRIELSLAYGDQELLRYTDDLGANRVVCENDTGTEFCSIIELSTIVSRRIGQ